MVWFLEFEYGHKVQIFDCSDLKEMPGLLLNFPSLRTNIALSISFLFSFSYAFLFDSDP